MPCRPATPSPCERRATATGSSPSQTTQARRRPVSQARHSAASRRRAAWSAPMPKMPALQRLVCRRASAAARPRCAGAGRGGARAEAWPTHITVSAMTVIQPRCSSSAARPGGSIEMVDQEQGRPGALDRACGRARQPARRARRRRPSAAWPRRLIRAAAWATHEDDAELVVVVTVAPSCAGSVHQVSSDGEATPRRWVARPPATASSRGRAVSGRRTGESGRSSLKRALGHLFTLVAEHQTPAPLDGRRAVADDRLEVRALVEAG